MRQIPSHPNYSATDGGRVVRTRPGTHRTYVGRALNPKPDRAGYLRVSLDYKSVYVHRLVAEAYYGPSELEVNHKNGIKSDNSPKNLEYVTPSENVKHAYRSGLKTAKRGAEHWMNRHPEKRLRGEKHWSAKYPEKYARGVNHHAACLSDDLCQEIDTLRGQSMTQRQIAKVVGISQPTVGKYLRGKCYIKPGMH